MNSYANRGKPFEMAVEARNAYYLGQGYVYVRFPTPYKVIRQVSDGLVVVPERQAAPDYLVDTGSLSIVADAKSCKNDRWKLDGLETHQNDFFQRWTGLSDRHRAGVILQIALAGTREFWLDWQDLGPVWRRWKAGEARHGEASLNEAWLHANATRIQNFDWVLSARNRASGVMGGNQT